MNKANYSRVGGRHTHSYAKAKKEISSFDSIDGTNQEKLNLGFVGNGYYIMLVNPEPYKLIKFFVRANSKANAIYRLNEFKEAHTFVKDHPQCTMNVISSGPQTPNKREGLVHEQNEKKAV